MTTTNFIWDFATDSYLMEKDETGGTTAVYTNEPVLYGNLISQRRGNTTSYYHFDGQGSTRQLTDQSQNTTDEYAYSAFGGLAAILGGTLNPFRYIGTIGYYFDAEHVSLYVRARDYDSLIGRWKGKDPVGFADGINLYVYCNSCPIILRDPSGTQLAGDPATLDADCLSYFKKHIETDQFFVNCLKAFENAIKAQPLTDAEKKDCLNVPIDCHCCKPLGKRATTGAHYDPDTRRIWMCSDSASKIFQIGPPRQAAKALCHEIIHAFQGSKCNPQPFDLTKCPQLIQAEIQAYYCTGGCNSPQQCVTYVLSILPPQCKQPTPEELQQIQQFADRINNGTMCGPFAGI